MTELHVLVMTKAGNTCGLNLACHSICFNGRISFLKDCKNRKSGQSTRCLWWSRSSCCWFRCTCVGFGKCFQSCCCGGRRWWSWRRWKDQAWKDGVNGMEEENHSGDELHVWELWALSYCAVTPFFFCIHPSYVCTPSMQRERLCVNTAVNGQGEMNTNGEQYKSYKNCFQILSIYSNSH